MGRRIDVEKCSKCGARRILRSTGLCKRCQRDVKPEKIESSLVLDLSEGNEQFRDFLEKQKVDYNKKVKKQFLFSGIVYFIPNTKGVWKRVCCSIDSYAKVGYNEDYLAGDEVKHRHVSEKNPSEARKRFYNEFSPHDYTREMKRLLRFDFEEKHILENTDLPANVGIKVQNLTMKKLHRLQKRFKGDIVDLRGLFCSVPDEITIKVPYKIRRVGKVKLKNNHIFHICMMGERKNVEEQKDIILKRYKKIKFG